jgi:long-subunit fatty acid transport protein
MPTKTLAALFALSITTLSATAYAGGYDTPMLYSARHMGMGGAAVGYVDDPSALFHNPAGLGHIENVSLLGDFSLLFGDITGSPGAPDQNVTSNTTIAPFFLVGGGFRITDFLVAGIAVYPVASAGATYEYEATVGGMTQQVEDTTSLVFIETSPGVAVNLDEYRLNIGVGYRITYVSLERTTLRDGNPTLALCFEDGEPCSMTGLNFAGFRAGVQWEAVEDHLSVGVNYRHKTVTTVESDGARAIGIDFVAGETDFTLPSRLVFGVRGDYNNIGAAIDVEWGFNSQNVKSTLEGTVAPGMPPVEADNVFDWDDALTLRVGAEYTIEVAEGRSLKPRLGYVFDARTSNVAYPTAFGTPPGPTHVGTLGIGYDAGAYELNLAFAHRRGSASVTAADVATMPEGACAFCSQPGDYEIQLNGAYIDFSYDFE